MDATPNKLAEATAKIAAEALAKQEKTPEEQEMDRRAMEKARKKLEQETIKKHRDFCARIMATMDQELQAVMPALDTIPNEAFLKGPLYAIGSIVHRAEEVVRDTAKQVRREMEVECAKELGKLIAPLNNRRMIFNQQKQRDAEQLRKEKQAKIMEAQAQIAVAYNEKIKQVDERPLPAEITELQEKRDRYEATYHKELSENEAAERRVANSLKALLQTAESELKAVSK